jgi:hypothetical protein
MHTLSATAPVVDRRRLLIDAGAALTVGTVAVVIGTNAKGAVCVPDPIIELIERHRASYRDQIALADAGQEDEWHATSRASDALAMEMLRTVPTTVPGVMLLLGYAFEHEHNHAQGWPDAECLPDGEWPADLSLPPPVDDAADPRPWQHYLCRHAALALAAIMGVTDGAAQ